MSNSTLFCSDTLKNQIPRYRYLELLELKKPNSNFFSLDTKDWPSLMGWFSVKVSMDAQNGKKKRTTRIKDLNIGTSKE